MWKTTLKGNNHMWLRSYTYKERHDNIWILFFQYSRFHKFLVSPLLLWGLQLRMTFRLFYFQHVMLPGRNAPIHFLVPLKRFAPCIHEKCSLIPSLQGIFIFSLCGRHIGFSILIWDLTKTQWKHFSNASSKPLHQKTEEKRVERREGGGRHCYRMTSDNCPVVGCQGLH